MTRRQTYQLVRLKSNAKSPFPSGKGPGPFFSKGIESHTLKSLVFAAGKFLFGEIIGPEFLDSFLLSSTFPCIQNEYFFPVPKGIKGDFQIQIEKQNGKLELQKLQFLSQDLFEDLLLGKSISLDKKWISECGSFSCPRPEVFTRQTEPSRQKVNAGDSGLDNCEESFPQTISPGLQNQDHYFLVEWLPDAQPEHIFWFNTILERSKSRIFKKLSQTNMRIEFGEKSIQVPASNDHFLSLSLYHPCSKGHASNFFLTDKNSSWELVNRGKYFFKKQKQPFYMFSEGSVFPKLGFISGGIELTYEPSPSNRKYQSFHDGRPLLIPLRR